MPENEERLDEQADEYEDYADLAICGGCGAYGKLGRTHVRNDEECGEFA